MVGKYDKKNYMHVLKFHNETYYFLKFKKMMVTHIN
jgi:hypothetical protein